MITAAARHLPAFPRHAIQVVPTTDREAVNILLSLTQYVDLCMPRGGEGLIRAVTECSKVPVIKHYKGVCHVYVDADADLKMAEEIAFNAKCQRPAVCNAMETLLVDQAVASAFLHERTQVRDVRSYIRFLQKAIAASPRTLSCAALKQKFLGSLHGHSGTRFAGFQLRLQFVI